MTHKKQTVPTVKSIDSCTIGFIGSGNMASAMISALAGSGLVKPKQIIVSDRDSAKLGQLAKVQGVRTTADNKQVAAESDLLILAVKPDIYGPVIDEIRELVPEHAIVISIAAGIDLAFMENRFGRALKVVRTMPNTPAMVSAGMTAVCPNEQVTEADMAVVASLLNTFGKFEIIPEKLFDAAVAVSGSSPAYVYQFIEALADGAVLGGMPRDKAYRFAAQAVLGSAQMVLETGKHPAELKDMVCSPGGTTIEAVYALEAAGFKGIVLKAMRACMDKCAAMSKR